MEGYCSDMTHQFRFVPNYCRGKSRNSTERVTDRGLSHLLPARQALIGVMTIPFLFSTGKHYTAGE